MHESKTALQSERESLASVRCLDVALKQLEEKDKVLDREIEASKASLKESQSESHQYKKRIESEQLLMRNDFESKVNQANESFQSDIE